MPRGFYVRKTPAWNKGLPKELQPRYGKKHSKTTKEIMSILAAERIVSEETRRKISLAQIGKKRKPHSEETKRKIGFANKGHVMSLEQKEKLRIVHLGKPSWNKGKHWSMELRKKLSESHKGYVPTEEQKKKQSLASNSFMRKPETREYYRLRSKERFANGTHNMIKIIKIRQSNARIDEYDLKKSEWKSLRTQRLILDGYTCQVCGADLTVTQYNVHHRIPFAISKDNSIDNLVSLCIPCHGREEFKIKSQLFPKNVQHLNNKSSKQPLDGEVNYETTETFASGEEGNISPKK